MKNRTWIMLRGLVREKGHWGPFLADFQSTFPADEVLAIDLPGTGEFRQLPSPTTMSEIFQFVRGQAIEKARTEGELHVVAVSLGAMVAMEWLQQKSEELAGVVMINTSSRALSPMFHRLRWQIWPRIVKLASLQSAKEREKGLIELLMNSAEAQEKALPLWSRLAVEHPIRYRAFLQQLTAAGRFAGLDQAPSTPVLLLNSLGDRLVDPSCSSALHERWNWPLERHPWAGHDLPWDDGAWTLQKISRWAASLNAGRK